MAERHRLQIHCPNGSLSEATIRLDGEQLMFVSRIELILDGTTREATARLTIPAALLDLDVDAAAFITAHAEPGEDGPKYATFDVGADVAPTVADGIALDRQRLLDAQELPAPDGPLEGW